MNNDEFYIGWEAKAAPGIGSRTQKTIIALVVVVLACATAFALSQRLIGSSVFEWGKVKTFSGVLETKPYPHLIADDKTYYLVAPWKFGLDQKIVAPLDHQQVTLNGTLIYRDNQSMIEAKPDSIKAIAAATNTIPTVIALGKQTLVGEIVDSKCFLGVMNPGQLTPHRSCAIRCISGGAPPVLLVRQKKGPAAYLLLTDSAGNPVNQKVLDLVAEPVEITGEVVRQGDLLILRADPATYHRTK